jgi:GAF domain-containing protein
MSTRGARAQVAGSPRTLRPVLAIEDLLAIERGAAALVDPLVRLWRAVRTRTAASAAPRSLDPSLREALKTMRRLLSVDAVAIELAGEAGDQVIARAAAGLDEELTVGAGARAGGGATGRVLASHEPLVIAELSSTTGLDPVLERSGLRSLAAVPLLGHDHLIGVLWAASSEEGRFSLAEPGILEVVAGRLAASLDRIESFERERTARMKAEQLAARIARIQRVTAELARTRSSDDVAATVVRALDPEHGTWRGVWLVAERRLERSAESGDRPPTWEPWWEESVDLESSSSLASAVASGRATYGVTTTRTGEGAWAVLPIVAHDGPLGALALVARRSGGFTLDERDFLDLVVGQAAQALVRARMADAERQAAERASFFARAAQVLAEADDLAATLDRLAELAVSTIGEVCLIDAVGEDGHLTRMAAKHRDPTLQPLVDRLLAEFPPDPGSEHPAVRAIVSAEATWSEDMSEELLRATTRSDEHFAIARTLGFRSYVTVPLAAADAVVGAMTCVSTSHSFGRDEIAFAEELAGHVAAVVERASRYESAFRTSTILQSSLLPQHVPEVPGVRVETRYVTANQSLEVGGDFYDLLVLPAGDVLFMVGDVAGHDRAAAAQMGHLRSAARALAGRAPAPSALLSALHSVWDLLGFERITTMVVGLLDPSTGTLSIASAGHYPPLLVGKWGATFLPVPPGPPLGVDAARAEAWRGRIEPGQVLLAYTDGAVDERAAGSDRSMAHLAEVAADGERTPVAVCDRVVAGIASERRDDVALLALSIERP